MSDFTPSLEDYIEAVWFLSSGQPEVRLTDVANRLGLSKASVSRAMATLRETGYLEQRKYGALHLTEAGIRKAKEVAKRHELLERFLTEVLKVDAAAAKIDACRMEHAISRETMACLIDFMKKQETT